MAGESELLVEEIIELTRLLRDLGSTVAAVDSQIMVKFGVAVDKNTKAVDENTAALKGSGKLVDQFGREIKSAAEETKDATKAQQEAAAVTRQSIGTKLRERSAAQEMFREYGRGVSATQLLRDRFEMLGGDSLVATTGLKAFSAVVDGAIASVKAMAGALYQGQRGATVSAKALTELVTPLAELATTTATMIAVLSMFGPTGLIGKGMKLFGFALGALGLATKAATKFNELAAEQTDKLLKSFNEISKAGVNLPGGLDQAFNMAQTLGLSVAELEEFNRLLTTNTQSLAMFGGTAAKGAERFAGAAGTLVREFGRELELMGVDRAEQREIAMSYMNIQARTGQIMNKSIGQLAAESARYVKELDMLAELTGSTRKQQMEAREAALAETRFRAARIEAERRGDTEQMRRLDIAERASAVARAAGDVRGATGILQLAAGRGAMTTPEAIAAEQTYRLSELFRQPNPTDTQIAQHLGKSVDLQQRNLAGITALIGNIDILQTDFVKSADLQRRQLVLAQEAEKAGYGRTPEGIEKYLLDIREGRIKATPEMQAVIDAGRTQQNAAMMMDSGIRAFNGAAQISLMASKAFADAVSMMPGAKAVGGGLSTGGAAAGTSGGAGAGAGPGAGGVTNTTGARVFQGGIMGSIESFVTQGRGFRSYTQGAQDVASLFDFRGGVTGNRENFDRLDPGFRDRLTRMAAEYRQLTGKALPFGSGQRSQEQNAQVGGVGSSLHMEGRAADLSSDAVRQLKEMGLLDRYGFKQNPRSGWHISDTGYRFGGVATGPKSGYQALLHGTEAVIPMPDGQSIKVDMPDFSNSISQQIQSMTAQISRLDELVALMRRQTQVSEKILQVSQA